MSWSHGIFLIRPLKIDVPSATWILSHNRVKRDLARGLVSKSLSWPSMWTWATRNWPRWTKSRTKWRSIAICFIREWRTGLRLSWVAPTLSQSRRGGARSVSPSSSRRDFIHAISEPAVASALYSASSEERATAFCFLVR